MEYPSIHEACYNSIMYQWTIPSLREHIFSNIMASQEATRKCSVQRQNGKGDDMLLMFVANDCQIH